MVLIDLVEGTESRRSHCLSNCGQDKIDINTNTDYTAVNICKKNSIGFSKPIKCIYKPGSEITISCQQSRSGLKWLSIVINLSVYKK